MKRLHTILLFVALSLLVGCQNLDDNRMVLLDEKVQEINVSKSNGMGDMNQDLLLSINDRQSIKVFENAIRTAVKQSTDVSGTAPDFDVMVEYGEGFPVHAIHLWLGEAGEESTLMYLVGEGETYVTSAKATNQLREILLPQSK